MTAGYGWWYGTYSRIPRTSQHTICFEIRNTKLTFRRLPRPRCPSPRCFLPEARGRACRSSWPEISDYPSRTNISYVSRTRGCIEGCWSWDRVYHRWGGPPKACQIEVSQVNTHHLPVPIVHHCLSLLFSKHHVQSHALQEPSTAQPLPAAQHLAMID